MLLGSLLLALAWAALLGEVTLANLSIGFVLGYAVLAMLEKGGVMPSRFRTRTVRALGLAGFFFWALLVANVRVALDVIRPRTSIRPAVVAIPLDVTTDAEIILLTTPVSAHMIARAAYRAEIRLWEGTVLDERREESSSIDPGTNIS